MEISIIGDYKILKQLGSSSFSEVFLAEHKFLKKRYAIKVIDESLTQNKNFIKSFEDKVGFLTTIDHPAIVKIHDISNVDGKYFLVMDPIVNDNNEVLNLEKYLNLKGDVLPELEIETILRQIASALDYAHKLNFNNQPLCHFSLKPSNIFIKISDHGLKVYISDFGLSTIIGEGKVLFKAYELLVKEMAFSENLIKSDSLDVSSKYKFLQNYNFLSPEQKFKDLNEKLSFKSDIFTFGVLAYYLIAREFPEGYFDLPSKIAPEYKLNWDLLICKCLQKDPHRRPDLLVEALNSFLSTDTSDISSLEILSWEEVEKKVENAMQMSFEFSSEVSKLEKELEEKKNNEVKFTTIDESDKKPIINPQKVERPTYDADPGAIFNKDLNVSYYQPKKVEIKDVEPILTEMVIIPGGSFSRGSEKGSRDEKPKHKVNINNFALDIHPVTNEQFVRFLQFMGGEKDSNNNDIIRLRNSRIKRTGGKLIIESGYAKHPVVSVSWYGAVAYAKWIGKRLPTEAEWEVAAQGGIESAEYPTGINIDHTQANFFNSDTTSVMSYPPNGYGLYDVVGNVYEWCEDWYAYNYYDTSLQEPEDPKGPPQGVYRVLRGGCWKSLKEDMRCSHRHRNNPGTVNSTYGFRCAADVS
ncbi:MAG: serine/threonine protein kinase [Chlamydiae bacterium RIFCSPHIGHO2_12_FULL_27_8]|nr:MAG: serine/threonine protein kinase [Chlamydiae bacterium RIFCSPHIGHO2_12_FULL_27_8]